MKVVMINDNDDELVRQRRDDSDRDSSRGLRSSLESLFQRRGIAERAVVDFQRGI